MRLGIVGRALVWLQSSGGDKEVMQLACRVKVPDLQLDGAAARRNTDPHVEL
jgi:hypothetical protein